MNTIIGVLITFLVIILVLALRPNGLFGRAIAERV